MDKKPFKNSTGNLGKNKRKSAKNIGFLILLALIGMAIFASNNQTPKIPPLAFSDVIKQANAGEIQKIHITQRIRLKHI